MTSSIFNKRTIDVDSINLAIQNKSLVIMPECVLNSFSELTYVTHIKKYNRKRKDGKQRYIVIYVEYSDADPNYCENMCSGGNTNSHEYGSEPLTSEEISERFLFYPQYRIKLD